MATDRFTKKFLHGLGGSLGIPFVLERQYIVCPERVYFDRTGAPPAYRPRERPKSAEDAFGRKDGGSDR